MVAHGDSGITLNGCQFMQKGRWEHYSHPADMGVRGFGPTREEAFAQAALAMTAIVLDLENVQPLQAVEIICEEEDDEMLFWYWLSAVLFEMGLRNMVFGRFEIKAIEGGLRAFAWGELVDVDPARPGGRGQGGDLCRSEGRPGQSGHVDGPVYRGCLKERMRAACMPRS